MCLPWCRLCRPVRPQRRFHRPLRRLRRPWRRKPPRLAPPVWRGQGHHVSRPACALFAAGNTLGPAKRCNRRARRASPGSSAAQESVVGCAFGARRRRCAHPRRHSAGHRAGHAGARTPRRYAPGGHSQTAWAARPHESARTRCSAENAPLAEGIAGAVCTLLQVGTRYTCTTGPKQPEFENNMHRFHGNMTYRATSRPNFTGGSPPDRTDIVRKETKIKVSALCILYIRTDQTFLEGGGHITPRDVSLTSHWENLISPRQELCPPFHDAYTYMMTPLCRALLVTKL